MIARINFVPYRLSLSRPFLLKKKSLSFREGLIVQVQSSESKLALGEIAPLESVSIESLPKAQHEARYVVNQLINKALPFHFHELPTFLEKIFPLNCSSSVIFGFEMALIHLYALEHNRKVEELLELSSLSELSVAGLLQGSVDEVLAQAQQMYKAGYRCFKLKVGNKNIPLDVKKVTSVQSLIGTNATLRLDVNGQWSLSEAVMFASLIDQKGIEFIEEPVADLKDVNTFKCETKLPVALDESLNSLNLDSDVLPENIDYFILKPMVAGGVFKTIKWIHFLNSKGKKVIISSIFESALARTMLAHLAFLSRQPAGLGTADWFVDDLRKRALVDARGVIFRTALNLDLTEVDSRLIL